MFTIVIHSIVLVISILQFYICNSLIGWICTIFQEVLEQAFILSTGENWSFKACMRIFAFT